MVIKHCKSIYTGLYLQGFPVLHFYYFFIHYCLVSSKRKDVSLRRELPDQVVPVFIPSLFGVNLQLINKGSIQAVKPHGYLSVLW